MVSSKLDHPAREGIRATLIGIIINAFLALTKGIAGVLGNSYALVADAIESTSDIFASIIVWWGLKVSAKPADENHPSGHGKVEPLSALVVGGFLIIASFIIAYQSVLEILTPHELPAPWTLLVLIVVVVVKSLLSKFSHQIADNTGSIAVKGDAWHHQSDALTSGAAFFGILIALIGDYFSPSQHWASADDWAALFCGAIIAFNGFSIVRSTLYELTDAHPSISLEEEVRACAMKVDGVINLDKCFIRKMGFDFFIELDVRVDGSLSVKDGHEIAHKVEDLIRSSMPSIRIGRVVVHIEPA